MDNNAVPPPGSPLDSLSEGNAAESITSRATAQSSSNQELNRSISSLLASADEMQHRQLLQQQWMLQQQLSQQSREELLYQNQIRAILEANARSQPAPRPPITSLQSLYGEQLARTTAPLGMDRGLAGIVPHSNDAATISALLQNIQRQNFEQEQLLRRQQHRDLMSGASFDLYPHSGMGQRNIAQLTSDLSAAVSSTSVPNYAVNPQSSLYSFTDRSDMLGSSNQALPETSSSLNANLQQQLLLQQYFRSQQEQELSQADRLAMLLQQRQDLHSNFPLASQNIPVADQSMHTSAVAKASSGKIIKSPLESGLFDGGFAPKPKRPLSAYNIFFQEERQKLLKGPDDEGNTDSATADDSKPAATHASPDPPSNKGGSKKRKRGKPHHKVSFEEMAKIIGQRWKDLQESDEARKLYYQNLAQTDKERYRAELLVWKKQRSVMISQQRKSMEEEEDKGEEY